MNKKLVLLLMIVAAIVVSACSGQTESEADSESCEASVTGTITFPGRADLPEDAVISVRILDTAIYQETGFEEEASFSDIKISDPGKLPVSYEVCYDESKVQEDLSYSMWVEVYHETSFMPYGDNKANNPVITKGNPTENVEIVITPGILDTQ